MRQILIALFAFGFIGSTISTSNNSYTYLVLVSEWPGSICHLNKCNSSQGANSTFWSLHGLWPTDPAGTGPAYCTNATFNPSLLTSKTQNDLTTYWSGLYASAEAFYSHEWQKHGTCWVPATNVSDLEEAFFNEAITLAISADVYGTLAAANITPRYESYSYGDFIKPLEDKFQKVQIQCQDNFVIGLNICMDLNYQYQDCPDTGADQDFLGFKSSSACGDYINYPVFTPDSGSNVVSA